MSGLMVSTLGRSEAEVLAWDQYVLKSFEASGYHLSGWRRVIEEAFGHPTCYLTVRGENGALCGLVPLVFLASRGFGRFLVSLPFVNYGGMIADSAEGCRLLEAGAIEQAKVLDAQHIELRHEAPWRRRGFRQNEKSRCVFPCPLRTKIC